MMEPRRLLDSRTGLERDILSAASREVAPEAARASVLEMLDAVLAGMAPGASDFIGDAARGTGAPDGSPSIGEAGRQLGAPVGSWGKLGLGLKASSLIPVGALAVAGVGLIGALNGNFSSAESKVHMPVDSASDPVAAAARAPVESSAPILALNEPLPRLEVQSSRREEALVPERSSPNLASRRSVARVPRAIALSHGLDGTAPRQLDLTLDVAAAEAKSATKPKPKPGRLVLPAADDWLGEQFSLLAEARRNLEAGDPEVALRLLDDYARRFPEGTLGPQVADLRRQASASGRTSPDHARDFSFGI